MWIEVVETDVARVMLVRDEGVPISFLEVAQQETGQIDEHRLHAAELEVTAECLQRVETGRLEPPRLRLHAA
jgi:hypothetical protein